MIRHIVMFKIKDEFRDEIPQLVKNFYGMKGKIEGMVSLEAGADFLHVLGAELALAGVGYLLELALDLGTSNRNVFRPLFLFEPLADLILCLGCLDNLQPVA